MFNECCGVIAAAFSGNPPGLDYGLKAVAVTDIGAAARLAGAGAGAEAGAEPEDPSVGLKARAASVSL